MRDVCRCAPGDPPRPDRDWQAPALTILMKLHDIGGQVMRELENPGRWGQGRPALRDDGPSVHGALRRGGAGDRAADGRQPGPRRRDGDGGARACGGADGCTGDRHRFLARLVARVAAAGRPNVDARVMDGQALALPDAGFDAVFSIFGVILFPDWRKGLAEMARVTRPGATGLSRRGRSRVLRRSCCSARSAGRCSRARERGHARRGGGPGRSDRLARAMIAAGYRAPAHPRCDLRLSPRRRDAGRSRDRLRHVARLDRPERREKAAVIAEARRMAATGPSCRSRRRR